MLMAIVAARPVGGRPIIGTSPKPLKFLVYSSIVGDDMPILSALSEQGHIVELVDDTDHDIILGPRCWRGFSLKYLDLAIKSARSVKYGKAKKSATIKAKSKGKKSTRKRAPTDALVSTGVPIHDISDEGVILADEPGGGRR